MKELKRKNGFIIDSKYQKTCILLKEHGYSACFNCPHDDCMATSQYVDKSEQFVSNMIDTYIKERCKEYGK